MTPSSPKSTAPSAGAQGGADGSPEATAPEVDPGAAPGAASGEPKEEGGAVARAVRAVRNEKSKETHETNRAEGAGEGEQPAGRAESDPDGAADPEAAGKADEELDTDAAAQQSRLPRLVRSMGTTAIGRTPRATPVGRPNRAALAAAAVAGVLLLSVPLVVLGWHSDKSSPKAEPSAGTVLNDDETGRTGRYEADTDADSKQDKPKAEKSEKSEAAEEKPAEAKTEPKGTDDKEPKAEKKKDEGEQAKKPSTPAKGKPALAMGPPMALRGHKSNRCIDVPNGQFTNGAELRLWECNGAKAQQWRTAEDGTLRIGGKCMDVRGSNFSNDSQIQLWHCNGSNAQKFVVNEARDLVNTSVGMCASGSGARTEPGTKIILFECTGTDNQKWN